MATESQWNLHMFNGLNHTNWKRQREREMRHNL